ncbi:MAG: FkbM family methyltransferase [Syntrophotaleaceae bacterium]
MKLNRKIAKAFGYELINLQKNPTSCSHVMNLIKHYGIDLVLDVGANKGQFGKMLRSEGYIGKIYSFEPVSKTFEELSMASKDDENWAVYKMALGDSPGELTINIAESSDLSSFLNPNDFGKEKFKNFEIKNQEKVIVETIDNFIKKYLTEEDGKRIFLKMDTQGYDLNVFNGALNSLDHIICILSELALIPIYSGMPHYLDVLKKYEEEGFVITGLYPISRKEDFSVIEVDCMLLNIKRICS